MSIDPALYARWRQEREDANQARIASGWPPLSPDLFTWRRTQTEEFMALATPTVTAKEKTTEPEADPIVICTPVVTQDPMTILVVGAGGNGARVIPPLTQMLRRQDRLFIMDHDIVEDRNLMRQHFTPRDIGQPKALVLAQRYQRRELTPTALVTQVTATNLLPVLQGLEWSAPRNTLILVGCIDNNQTRGILNTFMTGTTSISSRVTGAAYVDVGNERRGGQVLLSLRNWSLVVHSIGSGGGVPLPALYTMSTLRDAMPQLCVAAPWICDGCAARNDPDAGTCQACHQAPGTCGNRMDLQTVMVNHMAASMALNCLSWLLLGIPFSSAGAFFSTLNTIQPIRITRVDHAARRIHVDTRFAEV